MNIPDAVLAAASDLVKMYGPSLSLIGKKDEKDVYHFDFPDDEFTGYPFLYLYKPGTKKAVEVTGPEALDLLLLLGVE